MQLDEKKIVGYEIDVAVRVTIVAETVKTFHFKGSRLRAERQAMLKSGAIRVVEARPLTDAEWVRTYGLQQRM